jgi:hypothetical protein
VPYELVNEQLTVRVGHTFLVGRNERAVKSKEKEKWDRDQSGWEAASWPWTLKFGKIKARNIQVKVAGKWKK